MRNQRDTSIAELKSKFNMGSDDLLQNALFGLLAITCVMALANGFAPKTSRVDRMVPIFLQFGLVGLMLMPRWHGFPSEWFSVLALTTIWSVCTVIYSLKLYRSAVVVSKFLGVTQFVESLTALSVVVVGYIGSCYTYHGHFVLP